MGQADGSEKTEVLLVLEGEITKEEIGAFLEAAGTAVAEGETLRIITPTTAPPITPIASPTPRVTNTPETQPTRTPTRAPTSQPLSTTDKAHLWLQITDGILGVEVRALIFVDVSTFDLSVIVEGEEFINGNPMYEGESLKLSGILFAEHQDVTSVYATRGGGFGGDGIGYRCVKHNTSTEDRSVFACELRN